KFLHPPLGSLIIKGYSLSFLLQHFVFHYVKRRFLGVCLIFLKQKTSQYLTRLRCRLILFQTCILMVRLLISFGIILKKPCLNVYEGLFQRVS
ncbi:hypothetical protein HPB47_003749, partial [Ixodes persulcatus]